MEFITLAKKRCSTRAFLKQPVKQSDIDQISEAAVVAPTNGNVQNFHVYIVQEPRLLKEVSHHAQVYNAPLVMIVTYNKTKVYKPSVNANDSGLIDTSVVLTHMMLEATDLGLGSVWINYFKEQPIKELLKLSSEETIAHILALGYSSVPFKDENRHKKERKALRDLVSEVKESYD